MGGGVRARRGAAARRATRRDAPRPPLAPSPSGVGVGPRALQGARAPDFERRNVTSGGALSSDRGPLTSRPLGHDRRPAQKQRAEKQQLLARARPGRVGPRTRMVVNFRDYALGRRQCVSDSCAKLTVRYSARAARRAPQRTSPRATAGRAPPSTLCGARSAPHRASTARREGLTSNTVNLP